MKKALILSTALLCGVAANAAGRADSLLQAVEYSNSGLWLMADAVFDNVAIDQWPAAGIHRRKRLIQSPGTRL